MSVRPTTRSQKRKRSVEIDPVTESTPPPKFPWKRAGFRSAEEANVAFWDNLSKVPLCPSALRELDRRNSLVHTVKSATRSTGPTTRSATRRAVQVKHIVLENRAPQLKNFARRGGPDLHDLRGFSDPSKAPPTMPSRKNPYKTPSNSTESTKKTGRTSAYNPAFEQNLINHGVYPDRYEYMDDREIVMPDNWGDIQQRLTQPRLSLSPSRFSEGAFNGYKRAVTRAIDEAGVMVNSFPILQGANELPSSMKRIFQNLKPLTDGNIVDAQPDHYVGARPEQLNTAIQEKLGSYIVPSTNPRAPILPNNFTEAKGPGGTQAVAGRQACYDGALGARGMQQLQSYGQPEPVYDNNTYTITSTFDGEHLHMYTTHPTARANPGDQPEYHMNKLRGWDMTDNPESFRQGASAYRNARDWTKEKRDEFIKAANERAKTLRQDTSFDSSGYTDPSTSTRQAVTSESEMSADELALDYVVTYGQDSYRVTPATRTNRRAPPKTTTPTQAQNGFIMMIFTT